MLCSTQRFAQKILLINKRVKILAKIRDGGREEGIS